MDQELESSKVLTSEALRTAALAASARRGAPVARRRIVLRWSAWLLWGRLLPVIGLATVLAALLAFGSITFWGPARVFDASQSWLATQLGLPPGKAAPGPFDHLPDAPAAALPNFGATPSVIPQLQIDRNYSSQNPGHPGVSATPTASHVPSASAAPTAPVISTVPSPSSPPKPSGVQP